MMYFHRVIVLPPVHLIAIEVNVFLAQNMTASEKDVGNNINHRLPLESNQVELLLVRVALLVFDQTKIPLAGRYLVPPVVHPQWNVRAPPAPGEPRQPWRGTQLPQNFHRHHPQIQSSQK